MIEEVGNNLVEKKCQLSQQMICSVMAGRVIKINPTVLYYHLSTNFKYLLNFL